MKLSWYKSYETLVIMIIEKLNVRMEQELCNNLSHTPQITFKAFQLVK